jgi:hypothetical protein
VVGVYFFGKRTFIGFNEEEKHDPDSELPENNE